jgi:hypothetical protein
VWVSCVGVLGWLNRKAVSLQYLEDIKWTGAGKLDAITAICALLVLRLQLRATTRNQVVHKGIVLKVQTRLADPIMRASLVWSQTMQSSFLHV